MPRLSRVSQFAIASLLIATLVMVSACRGRPSLPTAATRTPTKAASALVTTPAIGATSPAGRTTAGPGTAVAGPTGAAPGTSATVTAPGTPAAVIAPGTPAAITAPGATPATAGPGTGAAPTPAPPAGTRTTLPVLTGPGGGQAAGAQCAAFDSALQVSASVTQVKAGQAVTITAKLSNNGCGTLAWPQYYLRASGSGFGGVLQPVNPPAMSHSVGVKQGQTDTAVWVLHAVSAGQAKVTVSVVFQAQTGAAGGESWNGTSAKPLQITVTR